MATDNSGYPYLTMLAAVDLSAKAGFIVYKNTTADQVTFATGKTVKLIGVLQNKPAATGRAATVQVAGVAKVKAGGTVAAGDYVTSDSVGRGIKFTPSAGAVEYIIGICMVGGAVNEVIEVLLNAQTVSTET